MKVLVGPDLDPGADLAELYAAPADPWLRVNMVETLDGAATGESGRSGSINNAVDKVVYHQLRSLADAILVGAGTARVEGYAPVDRPTVVVSRRGHVPDLLRGGTPGSVLLATCASAELLDEASGLLGDEHVLVLGSQRVDLPLLKQRLAERGLTQLLCEGGPHLLRDLLAAGAVDELCATIVPRLVGGEHPRITQGPPVDVPLQLHLLLEHAGTLLGRWTVSPESRGVTEDVRG
ncbi:MULTISPECIES: dihydrofolate reductase family protein [unclassified Nocardioides]|uniref:dihydrofolate reductase family protein n=1 Tax=Nocardioides sp. URHA0032 TaxID=1380388 RepID=UPI000684297F|nr:dihydrofolate reductase family protein [Nocardioides sp. URHA0032]